MIRILYVLNGPFRRGGTEAVILNYYKYIDKSRFQIEFAVHALEKDCMDNTTHHQLLSSGAALYYITPRSISIIQNRKDFEYLFSNVQYDIIHSHMDSIGSLVLSLARKSGIPVRIAHSHSTNHQITIRSAKKLLHFLFLEYCRYTIRKNATNYIACSSSAAKWLFGAKALSNVLILPNAIEAELYAFSSQLRKQVRKELTLDEKLVIGHVGSFSKHKNHAFMLDIFQIVHSQLPQSTLLFVGDGPLMEQTKKLAVQKGLDKSVIFFGATARVPELMQAMDILLLPSTFEGLGMVSIEAQASGLKVISSTAVPMESSIISELNTFLPLTGSAQTWSNVILKEANNLSRRITTKQIAAAGYDIHETVHKLENFYTTVFSHLS